jgi:hypothetical protein
MWINLWVIRGYRWIIHSRYVDKVEISVDKNDCFVEKTDNSSIIDRKLQPDCKINKLPRRNKSGVIIPIPHDK